MAIDHFEKNKYQTGRTDWNFNILIGDRSKTTQMVEDYSSALSHPSLYSPIPAAWLHVTVLRAGFTTDFNEDEMGRVMAGLRRRLNSITAPEVAIDSWWIWSGNVVTHVSPDDRLLPIYEAVIESLTEIVGEDRMVMNPHKRFLPHITLAYTKSHHQELELHSRLGDISVTPITFTVDRVSLVKQYPLDGHYEWDIFDEAFLG